MPIKMKAIIKSTFYLIILTSLFFSCNQKTKETATDNSFRLPDFPWLQKAVIYQVNFLSFSNAGNFKGFEDRLDSVKNLGVDMLCFLSVPTNSNLKSVKKELGSLDDFRNLVEKCHTKKIKVILNWEVQNITGKNAENSMIETMKCWINECDIDGFHCNISGGNTIFWQKASSNLNQTKKIAMFSNTEEKNTSLAFNASDGNEYYELLKGIYKNVKNADSLVRYLRKAEYSQPKINHLSLNNTGFFGEAQDAFTALTFTINGLPLIYNGMEVGYNNASNQVAINWNPPNAAKQIEFYKTLISIRHTNPALWTNVDEQTNTRIFENEKEVYAFIRQSGENKVLVVINLSGKTVKMDALEIPGLEQYNLRLHKNMKTDGEHLYQLGPWGYSVSTFNEPSDK